MLDVLALLEVPVDVLDRHRRVVDQDADGERETAERHDVEVSPSALSITIEPSIGQRNRDRDDDRRAPAAQEDRIITLVSNAAMMPS
jgi:hypothetical protein